MSVDPWKDEMSGDDDNIVEELAKQKKEAYDKIQAGKMFKNVYEPLLNEIITSPNKTACLTEISRIETQIKSFIVAPPTPPAPVPPQHPWIEANVLTELTKLTKALNDGTQILSNVKIYTDFNSGVSEINTATWQGIGITFVISLNALSSFIKDVKNQTVDYYSECFKYSHGVKNSEFKTVLNSYQTTYLNLKDYLHEINVTAQSTLAEANQFKSTITATIAGLESMNGQFDQKIKSEIATQEAAKVEISNMVKTTTVILASSTIGNILQ